VAAGIAIAAGFWAWHRLVPLPPPPAASTAPLPPRVIGFRLDVERTGEHAYAFSRAQLEAALKDPYQLTYLGRIAASPAGGVEVLAAPRGSLTQRLGLEAGDVIHSINGQPVATLRDLGRIYAKDYHLPRMQGEVRRGAQLLRFSYVAR